MSPGYDSNRQSFHASNRYRFHCPTVGREETFLACRYRRFRHWRGESVDKPECRMCMSAGKCPMIHMMKAEDKHGDRLYFDPKGEVVHRLSAEILAQIEPVVIRPFHAFGHGVSDEWVVKLTGDANGPAALERWINGAAAREAAPKPAARVARAPRKAKEPEAQPDVGMLDLSKVKVDLADAINAAGGA